MPAHIPVANPFLVADQIRDPELVAMVRLCAGMAPLHATFETSARLSDRVYLRPHPSLPLRQLSDAFAQRWPGRPPAQGTTDAPYLLVGRDGNPRAVRAATSALHGQMPIHAVLSECQLWNTDGHRWRLRCRMPFASADKRTGEVAVPASLR